MPITLGTNIASVQAQRRLFETGERLSSVFERLASGQRINRASDDAAGLAISSSLNADARVFTQAVRNINDGVSLLNIVEGALSELTNITTRQMELAEQSANGVYTAEQRAALSVEANALVDEYNRIVESTEFNGLMVLDPNQMPEQVRIQLGYGLDGSIAIDTVDGLGRNVGDGTFEYLGSFNPGIGRAPRDTELVDLNGDGNLDLISAGDTNSSTGRLSVQLGNGDGTFGGSNAYSMHAVITNDFEVADVNEDGILDIVATGSNSTNAEVIIRLGNGDGTFGGSTTYAAEDNLARAIAVRDVNQDGNLDIVTNGTDDSNDGFFTVRLGDGTGTFGTATSFAINTNLNPADMAITDLNGDGAEDIVIAANTASSWYAIHLNDGNGSFSELGTFSLSRPGTTVSVVVGDINGDGDSDLVFGGNGTGGGGVSVLMGNGDGTFAAEQEYKATLSKIYALDLEDINGDGLLDILAAGNGPTDVYEILLATDEEGGFASSDALSVTGAGRAYTIAAGDVNNDGVADFVGAGLFASSIDATVHLSNTLTVNTIGSLDMSTQVSSREALDELNDRLSRITSEAGTIGASLSRLEAASNTLQVTRENYLAAASRIQDVDIAEESARLVRNNILQQTASAILAQANQQPALALQLLRGGP